MPEPIIVIPPAADPAPEADRLSIYREEHDSVHAMHGDVHGEVDRRIDALETQVSELRASIAHPPIPIPEPEPEPIPVPVPVPEPQADVLPIPVPEPEPEPESKPEKKAKRHTV